jgi:PAS domain S-box-containing protein
MRESEKLPRKVVDGLGPYMFVGLLTPDGTLIMANQPALQIAGLKPEDVLGKPLEETYWLSYSESVKQRIRNAIRRARRGEICRYDEVIRVTENGFITIDFCLQPLFDEAGNIVYLLPSAVDITGRKQAEESLRESEEGLRLALDAARMGTFDWDMLNNRITWSCWHEELWGYKPGEFEGTYEAFAERVHHEDLPGINAEVARCIADRKRFSREFRVIWPDGSVHWVMGTGEFTFGKDGQPLRMRGVVLETTEFKRMEERILKERDFSEAMIESLPGIFYLYDDTRRFMRWNKNFERVSGYSAEEIAGMSPLDFFTGEEKRLVAERIQEVFTKGESSVEADFVSKNGRKTPYYFTGLRITVDNTPCLIGMGIDITDRKRAEEALKRACDELEKRVEERTRELVEANIRLKELDRLKAEFLATMSHELRTPLNSIIGFTGMILQGMAGEINDEQKRQLSMVYTSAKHLLGLINDILDLSRIEAGRMEVLVRGFRVDEVVSEVVQSLSPIVSQKGLRLTTEIPDGIPEIRSDRKKFFQILLNLVNNAVKFTERGEIRIACRIDSNNLEVSVSDTGMGIEDMGLLFEAFRQVDETSRRRYEGTGLGLYLCKKLLDLLGGRIWVESEYGKGSRFTFILPLSYKGEEDEKENTDSRG